MRCDLVDGAAAVVLPRDVVRVFGPDTMSYLQGQLSQDVSILAIGGSAFSLLLEPAGKVNTFLRITRTGADEVVLDTDAGWGEVMVARLQRFKLRTKCELVALDWACVAVRGRGSVELAPAPEGIWPVQPETPHLPGFDLLGPGAGIPAGAIKVGLDDYEGLRIEAGVPRMGSELTDRTIPAEAGIVDRSASFTKGCYTGQELVARIDSRGGNVPRRLRGVRIEGEAAPPVGTVLVVGEREVGALTSVGRSPSSGSFVALAYVRRDVEVPAEAVLRFDGGEAPTRVEALPLGP